MDKVYTISMIQLKAIIKPVWIWIGILLLAPSFSLQAIVFTSVQSGDYSDPATWGTATAPKLNDDVVISSGHTVVVDGAMNSTVRVSDVTIQSSAELNHGTFVQLEIRGNYLNDGTHGGVGAMIFRNNGAGTLDGTGVITNLSLIDFRTDYTIASSANLTKSNGNVYIFNGRIITNFGSFSIGGSLLGGDATSRWINSTNSVLRVGGALLDLGVLEANTVNSVHYNGGVNQSIKDPLNSTYYNLIIAGSGTKTLTSNLLLLNNLALSGGTLAHDFFDIMLSGDWINNGGIHDGSNGKVTMTAPNPQTISHASTETFFKLFISGADVKTLACNLLVNDSLIINSALDVTAANYSLELKSDWDINGTFFPQDAIVRLTGSTIQTINAIDTISFFNLEVDNPGGAILNSGVYELRGTLTLTNGTFNTNNALTIISNPDGTGRIAEITGGSIIGDITMQRYVNPGATGWKFLTSPVSGKTLQDWNDDFHTSGFNGSDDPGHWFVSIYTYNETVIGDKEQGYVPASDISNTIDVGQGFWAYVGPVPLIMDVTGPPNTGSVNIPVTYTDDPDQPSSQDGWNMVGNPYPSSINWDLIYPTTTDLANIIYIWDADLQNYRGWSGGIGLNGGVPDIPSSQAFWVQTVGNSPDLPIEESMKSPVDAVFRGASISDQAIRLTATASGNSDQAVLRVVDGATLGLDPFIDGHKLYTNANDVPKLAILSSDSFDMGFNSIGTLTQDVSIPVRVTMGTSATCTIEAEGYEFFASDCIMLEDLFTGTATSLKDSGYTFSLSDTTTISRFLLHISAPVSTDKTEVTCNGENDGQAIAKGIGSGPWDFEWKDNQGIVIKNSYGKTTADTLSNIEAGLYRVNIDHGSGFCPLRSDTFNILQPDAFSTNAIEEAVSCFGFSDGNIDISVSGATPPYTYSWSEGSVTQDLAGVEAGVYSVTISDSVSCSEIHTVSISEPLEIIADFTVSDDTLELTENGATFTFTNNSSVATDFLWEFGDGNSSSVVHPQHTYTNVGFYLVNLLAYDENCQNESEYEIAVIEEALSVKELTGDDPWIRFSQHGNQVRVDFKDLSGNPLKLSAHDMIGKKVAAQNLNPTQNFETLDFSSFAEGIYLINLETDQTVYSRKVHVR